MTALLHKLWAWRERRVLRQFVKFCFVGGLNTAVDFGLYVALTRLVGYFAAHYLQAATLAFGLAILNSFVLNTFWTFRAGGEGWQRRAPQFLAVAVVGLLINNVVIYAVVEAGGHDLAAKVLATGIVVVWNFLAQKFWTFRLRI